MGEAQWKSAFSGMAFPKANSVWREALGKQDGYRLLTLLRGTPDLLFVQCSGCNVLHLAIRNRWYGLVREVLLKFCPLHTYASEDHSEPTQYFSQEQFWCLLKEKESHADEVGWLKPSSGLDVLAMAVIQGHGAINTILAEAVQRVGGALHYYGGEVIRWEGGQIAWDVGRDGSGSSDNRTLIKIIARCFTGESIESSNRKTENEPVHAAPTVSASATGSQETPGGFGPNLQQPLEDKIDPAWKKEWKVTSPFLPFEEFFFLACCFPPVAWRESSFGKFRYKLLRSCTRIKELTFQRYLLDISDTWGTAIHHAVLADMPPTSSGGALSLVLKIVRKASHWSALQYQSYVNRRDNSGRTPLYTQLALGQKSDNYLVVLADASKDTRYFGRYSFGKGKCEIDVKAVSVRNGYSPHEPFSEGEILGFYSILRSPHLPESRIGWMTRMIAAAYRGDVADLRKLAESEKKYIMENDDEVIKVMNCTALHIAAAAGYPHVIRAILATGKFDPLVEDWEGNSALHLATHFETPLHFPHSLADFCEIPYRRIGNSHSEEFARERKELLRMAESRRQGCINLLLQAGIDVSQINKKQEIADPGPKCSPEYSTWWFERVSKETLEAKSSLTAGANAISVTAALVATASYIGPLQPPLGYAAQSEGMQVDHPTVRIFIVCNTLAFYLALAAIILSLTPSLPMPQESMLDELKLTRRTVTLAVGLLILSIVAVLIAFASASIAVTPDENSWNHRGVTVNTISVGAFVCLLVLILCLFRVVRLVFHRNKFVRSLYRRCMCIFPRKLVTC